MNGYHQFVKRFYGPGDLPTVFKKKVNRTLGHRTLVWLDDIIIVNRGTKEKLTCKLFSVLAKMENEGYRAKKEKKPIFYQNETKRYTT